MKMQAHMGENVKIDLREKEFGYILNVYGSKQVRFAGSCERSNKRAGSIKVR